MNRALWIPPVRDRDTTLARFTEEHGVPTVHVTHNVADVLASATCLQLAAP